MTTLDLHMNICASCGGTGHHPEPSDTSLDIEEVVHIVTRYFNIREEDLTGPSRSGRDVYPRHVAWYCIRAQAPEVTLVSIGQYFRRHHASVIHGVRRISEQLTVYEPVANDVRAVNLLCARQRRRASYLLSAPGTSDRVVGL